MPSTLIRFAVALLTFGLGVSATMFWIAYRTPDVSSYEGIARQAHPLPPPPPPLPTIEEELPPPPPPAARHITGLHSLGGINIEQRLLSKPAPAYPPAAVAANVSGLVEVWVTVDKNGKVIWANALSGHHLLQKAAVGAAYEARFSPAQLDGQPVNVSGLLTYNFVLP